MDLREFLKMRLYSADGGGAGGGTDDGEGGEGNSEGAEGTDGGDDDNNTGGTEGSTGGDPVSNTDGKTFTQEELDRIIAERLAREQKKKDDAVAAAEAKAEAERLAEEGKFKELADNLQAQLDATKAEVISVKKSELLKDAGYTKEQAELFANLIQGETDEELNMSLELLKTANPPVKKEYVDPSALNGRKEEPKKKDPEEAGKSLFQRLKDKGKIK